MVAARPVAWKSALVMHVVDAPMAPGVTPQEAPEGEGACRGGRRSRPTRRARTASTRGGTCSGPRRRDRWSRRYNRKTRDRRGSVTGAAASRCGRAGRRPRGALGSQGKPRVSAASVQPRSDDEDVVGSAGNRLAELVEGGTKLPLDAVALDRAADARANRETEARFVASRSPPRRGNAYRTRKRVETERPRRYTASKSRARESRLRRFMGHRRASVGSRREAGPALGAAALEDRPTRTCRHACSESVPAFPPADVRLVGSLHRRSTRTAGRGR